MLLLLGISGAAIVFGMAAVLWLMAIGLNARARARDAMAETNTGSVSLADWNRIRRLKQAALACLVLSLFAAACLWAVFGGAIMDAMA